MPTDTLPAPVTPTDTRRLDRPLAAFGAAWSAFGVFQFLTSTFATVDAMMAMGRTAQQVAVYQALPSWMTLVFAVGVFGGLIGSLLVFARRGPAVAVLGVSLIAYLALYVGDIVYGVFNVFGAGQAVVLTFVVLVAAALLGLALLQRKTALRRT